MIGDALRMIRVFHDIFQKDLAARLHVAPSHLSEIESNKKTPTLDLLAKYSSEFQIPISSILFFSEKMETGSRSDKLRVSVSDKVLALLRFIAARSGKDAA